MADTARISSPAPREAQPPRSERSQGTRSAQARDDQAGAAAPQGGFAQLLAALGAGADDGVGMAWQAGSEDAVVGGASPFAPQLPADASGPDAGLAATLAALAGWGRHAEGSLQAQTAQIDGAADAMNMAGDPGNSAAARRPAGGRGTAAGWIAAAQADAAGAWGAAGAGSRAPAQGATVQATNAADAGNAATAAAPAGGAAGLGAGARSQEHAALPAADAAEAPPPLATADMANAAGLPAARPAGQGGMGAAGEAGAAPVVAGAQTHEGTEASAEPTPAGAPDEAFADQLADQLAQQATFWVHQKLQNAELTLGRDAQALQIKVTLDGDAAHVRFLSDDAGARDALQASAAELRALLQGQGLELAGLSVGAQAQQGRGDAQGGRGADGAPQRQTLRVAPAGVDDAGVPPTRRAVTGERRVDLFV